MKPYQMLQPNKVYQFWDYIIIPFKIAPFHMTVNVINKLVMALIPSLQVFVIARFIDTASAIFQDKMSEDSIYLPLVLLMLFIAYGYLNWSVMSVVNDRANMRLNEVLRSEMLRHRASLKYRYIEDAETWDLISRTCGDLAGSILAGFYSILGAAEIFIRVGSILLILLSQALGASIVILVVTIPLFFLAYKGGKATYQANVTAAKYSRRASCLHKVLTGRDAVNERTVFGYTDEVNREWLEKYEAARKINLKTNIRYYIRMKGASLITVLISLIITGVLAYSAMNGELSPGLFMGLVTASFNLVQMMSWTLANTMKQLSGQKEYLKDLTAVMGLKTIPDALEAAENMPGFSLESIKFSHVSFCYPGTDRYILRDISFTLEKGRTYALAGANGAGKTTVIKLLTGLYDQYEGEIYINDRPLRSYSPAQLKSVFSVVYQDFCKYAVTLRQNLKLGRENEFSEERALKSLEAFGLSEIVSRFPQGLDTPLGKVAGDHDLSGGEWQRLALARLWYTDAPVFILDEPTAALDPVAESNMYSLFHEISKNKTTIFITHRLGAAKVADKILVIDNGRIAESGSYQELISLNGVYAGMYNRQKEWYEYGT